MKKFFLFPVFMLLALSINASMFDNGNLSEEFNSLKENSEFSVKLDAAIKSAEAKALAQSQDNSLDDFIIQYKAKIKAAKSNQAYQAKLAELKKKPMPHVHLTKHDFDKAKDFMKYFITLRNKIFERVKKYDLPNPNKENFSEEINDILHDERYSYITSSDYYKLINECIYDLTTPENCSYIISARSENMISIAKEAIDVEDMPVFYGAMNELNKVIKKIWEKKGYRSEPMPLKTAEALGI